MAKQVIINVKANTANARSELDETKAEIKKLNSEVVKVGDKSPKEFKKLEKGSKKTGDSIKKTTIGFKAFGLALKGLGIGLLIGAFTVLQDLFKQNQRVTDIFKVSFEALSLVFADLVRFVDDSTIKVKSFFNTLFNEPQVLVKDFIKNVIDSMIIRVQSAIDMFGKLSSAVIKLFKGDFKGALEDSRAAGDEFIDVITGVDDSVQKTADAFNNGIKSIKEYTKGTIEQANSNVKLKKSAELAAIANQGLIEKFDRQAEQLRQQRDDERLSIEERKKANDELAKVLDEQEKIMLKNAQIALDSALIQLQKDKDNIESKKAVMEAENELAAIQAQIDGFRSEQKTNDLALDRETIDLINSKKEAENSLLIDKQRFNAEQIENEFLRLQALRDVADEERKLEVNRLTEKRNSFNAGTQAFIDAQSELDDFQQKSGQESVKLTADIEKAKQVEITNALGNIAGIVGANSKFGKGIAVVSAIRDTYAGATKALAQGGIFGFIQAAAIIASGLANVKTITSTNEPAAPSYATGGGSSGGVSVPTPQAPAFNIVGSDPQNQLAQTLAEQTKKPVKAFVVAGDVSTAQSLDRNIIQESSLG
tara:strand:- start:928 stop:2709 length:1782 start_codon:yes stop_codon:yes gene_type:complete